MLPGLPQVSEIRGVRSSLWASYAYSDGDFPLLFAAYLESIRPPQSHHLLSKNQIHHFERLSYVECQFDPSIICYVFVKCLVTVYLKAEKRNLQEFTKPTNI